MNYAVGKIKFSNRLPFANIFYQYFVSLLLNPHQSLEISLFVNIPPLRIANWYQLRKF